MHKHLFSNSDGCTIHVSMDCAFKRQDEFRNAMAFKGNFSRGICLRNYRLTGKKRFLNQTLKKVLKQDNIHLFVSNYNESLASQSL